ncbi:hypothetical protein F7Q91_03375 [Vibrio chagasii]|uniref:Uncharacterized protein n=1 Tax=Vibrio chagasii TaxID=170679 RepID=A0A7V7NX51_9VIBR|nr:hypothetical protein [Vibrio chagasii]KAB0482463.1 hypothetical protein F7Q91_03375 [Vibrio chagasii]
MNRWNCKALLCSLILVAPLTVFAQTETYEDIQEKRMLSAKQNDQLNSQELQAAERQHRNKMKMLDNEYKNLLLIEKGLIQGGSAKKEVSDAEREFQIQKYQSELEAKELKDKEVALDSLIKEMESQIYLTDLYEVAGLIRGEFWYQGANEILTEGAIFGEWYIKDLSFDGALIEKANMDLNSTEKSNTRQLKLMGEDEALSRFKKSQKFRDQIIEQKLGEMRSGVFNATGGQMMPNNSPSPGLMFK